MSGEHCTIMASTHRYASGRILILVVLVYEAFGLSRVLLLSLRGPPVSKRAVLVVLLALVIVAMYPIETVFD